MVDASSIDALVIDGSTIDTPTAAASPVSACTVDTMTVDYPGNTPPNPYTTPVAASACILAAHDAIILLGCPSNDDGTPSSCQTDRADIAVALAAAGYGGNYITSGAAVHNAYVEADALAALLIARGVPDSSIWRDELAQHTDENIYYSTQIMAAHGWQNAIVVTEDPGQLVYTGLCDSNCCVDLGRLTVEGFPVTLLGIATVSNLGHYVRYPWTPTVTGDECTQIEQPTMLMCTQQSSRDACAGNLMLP